MRAALPGLLAALQADPEVRVVVLTGAGDKAFASGADISEFGEQRTSPAGARRVRPRQAALSRRLERPGQARHRHDPRLLHGRRPAHRPAGRHPHRRRTTASSASRPPGSASGYGLSGVDHPDRPGRPGLDGGDAVLRPAVQRPPRLSQMGLVNRVVPAAELREQVMALARAIAANAPLTVAAVKVAIRAAGQPPGRATWPRSRRWSRPASGPTTTWRASAPSPRSGRPPSPGVTPAQAHEAACPNHPITQGSVGATV